MVKEIIIKKIGKNTAPASPKKVIEKVAVAEQKKEADVSREVFDFSPEMVFSTDEIEDYEERAGIIEYESQMEREAAEREAKKRVLEQRKYTASEMELAIIELLGGIQLKGKYTLWN